MPEATPTCKICKKYHSANPAIPGDPGELCLLHSKDKNKDRDGAFTAALRAKMAQGDYDFRQVFFPGLVDFSKHIFQKRADFSRATFSADTDFSQVTFGDRASFSESLFEQKAYFFLATFEERAEFLRTNFYGETIFIDSTFTQAAIFHDAVFDQRVSFFKATFRGGAGFYRATFKESADFSGLKLSSRVYFDSINLDGTYFRGNFLNIDESGQGTLSFKDMSLLQVRFTGSDLRTVVFQHVRWHPYRGRQAIYEEVLLRQEEKKAPWFWNWLLYDEPHADPPSFWTDKYGEVERLYRDLQENYEKVRDYKKMGDFHYGEMEMHRRANKWRWFPFYWYNLYWALSGYGERPSRALGWLAAFLAIFTSLLAWAGLEILDPKHSAGFGNSFFYLLQKVTLQRPTWAEPVGFWGKLVAGFSVLLIPGQAALFLLALRNRLGRRR